MNGPVVGHGGTCRVCTLGGQPKVPGLEQNFFPFGPTRKKNLPAPGDSSSQKLLKNLEKIAKKGHIGLILNRALANHGLTA